MVQRVNATLDNVSPLIEYSPAGAWIDGATLDPFWQSYDNNGTFTLTTVYGASASFTFNGTAIWIYGAKRGNHGPYNITLDGRTSTDNGFYDGQLFQQVLFSAVELNGTEPHTVSIVNSPTETGRPYLDVDSIVYQAEIPDDYQEVKQQDTASAFKYSPSGWNTDPENLEGFDGDTGHTTSLEDAYAVYTFEVRSHVEFYGVVGPSAGLYTVQLDNGVSRTFNSSRERFSPQMVLYQESGLSPGKHTMKIMNSPFSGQTLSIDYAVVRGPPNSTNTGDDSSSPPPSTALSGGAIGGIVAGISGLIIVVLVGLFFWYRRRHRRPVILPQEVLQAEFADDEGGASVEGSSTHLTPYLHSTITRYPLSSPTSLPLPSPGYDLPGQTDPLLYQAAHQSGSGPSSGSRFAVRNADQLAAGSGAADEKRRLAMRERGLQAGTASRQVAPPNAVMPEKAPRNAWMQVDDVQDFEQVTFAPRNSLLPPYHRQATEPFPTEKR